MGVDEKSGKKSPLDTPVTMGFNRKLDKPIIPCIGEILEGGGAVSHIPLIILNLK